MLRLASADASYGLLVALGLSFSGVLAQAYWLQIFGGVLIIGLGLLSLHGFFFPKAKPKLPQGALRWLDFISGTGLVLWGGWIALTVAFLP